jgi:hypothetical protein
VRRVGGPSAIPFPDWRYMIPDLLELPLWPTGGSAAEGNPVPEPCNTCRERPGGTIESHGRVAGRQMVSLNG